MAKRGYKRKPTPTGSTSLPTKQDGNPVPPEAEELLQALADPTVTATRIVELSKQCGIPASVTKRLKNRLETRYIPVVQELRKITTKELQDRVDDRLARTIDYLDDFVLSKANARDLAVIIGILSEKRALLRGEPTQIIDFSKREAIHKLMPAMMAEAERRGLTVDLTPADYTEVGKAPEPRVISEDKTP